MEENSEAWGVFLAAGTQFNWTGGQVSTPSGLDYPAVNLIREARGVKSSQEFWDRLAIMESEAINIMRAHTEKALKKNG